jgi:hypothetical protein
MAVNLEDAYLTIYAGQDYAQAIARIIKLEDPFAPFATKVTGHTLGSDLVWMDGERDWRYEASELALAIGMRLKKDHGVWVLFPGG